MVAKSNMTRESDMINPFINMSWVDVKWVQVIFGLTWQARLINMRTCLTCLAYKVIIYFDIIASLMVCFYIFITIFVVIIEF